MANNHFLNSALYWWWVRFLDFSFSEHILRWPSYFRFCQHFIDGFPLAQVYEHRVAGLDGDGFAISPVFGAFAYQVRGYSLAMFLSLWAHPVSWSCLRRCPRGQYWLCLSCFLLPLVMPSAATLGASLSLFCSGILPAAGVVCRLFGACAAELVARRFPACTIKHLGAICLCQQCGAGGYQLLALRQQPGFGLCRASGPWYFAFGSLCH